MHNDLGLLYQDQNRLDDAAYEFQRGIAITPRHFKAYDNLGAVRMAGSASGGRGRVP